VAEEQKTVEGTVRGGKFKFCESSVHQSSKEQFQIIHLHCHPLSLGSPKHSPDNSLTLRTTSNCEDQTLMLHSRMRYCSAITSSFVQSDDFQSQSKSPPKPTRQRNLVSKPRLNADRSGLCDITSNSFDNESQCAHFSPYNTDVRRCLASPVARSNRKN